MMPPAHLLLGALGLSIVAAESRLTARNQSLYLDGVGPHFFRAVHYSPTPWGYDNDWAFKTSYYENEWPELFDRDFKLMALMGVNAVRIPGFLGSATVGGRHTEFLDAAYNRNISVFLSYDFVGAGENAVSLLDISLQESAAQAFRLYLERAKHPATVMVFIGESVNRDAAGFVCNVPRDQFGFATDVPCQFGEDVEGFADAMELLCQEAILFGLACTVPMANVPLPLAVQVARYGPASLRPSLGIADWFDAMAPRMPSMKVLSAVLSASNTSSVLSGIKFEVDLDTLASRLPRKPFLIADYGIDAFNSTEWFAKAGELFDNSFPIPLSDRPLADAQGRLYRLKDEGVVPTAENDEAQAAWLSALTSELQRDAVDCSANCGSARWVSGGVVRSWGDEWWRAASPPDSVWHGAQRGVCASSDVCFAMGQLCPPVVAGDALQRSPCGAPFAGMQPDGYVNEEWFGLISYERSCDCLRNRTSTSACAPHELKLRARGAYYALQALWNPDPSALPAAQEVFEEAYHGYPTAGCTAIVNTWACQPYPQAPRLQHRPGTLELYLDCELFLMRGICYSPTPFGDASKGVLGADPGYSEPWGDYFTDEWHQLFRRDMDLFQRMGANTIRKGLYTLKTSVRHGTFLDLAYERNLTVIATYEIGVAMKTPLTTLQDISSWKTQLRLQIRSSIHPAIIFWMVGNELNGAWHFFVCDDWYAQQVGKPWGLDRCLFGGDAPALLRAIDELCSVVVEEGLPCSTAFADVPLPLGAQVWPSYDPRGALGWMKLMDGSSSDFTLKYISIWSLNLYKGRNFTGSRIFEDYVSIGGTLPILITEFGIDALDTNGWYEACIANAPADAPCRTDGGFDPYVNQEMQADWVLSLVEDLERHATTCQEGCLSHVSSGGCVIGWADESWKGRVIDAVLSDHRSIHMACPDPRSDVHSLCGYPNSGQPDGFVNEEWFGLLEVNSVCPGTEVDQLRPRLAWHGLSLLWKQGGCTPQLGQPASYSVDEYPLCGEMMTALRQVWFDQKSSYDGTPAELRKDLLNWQWLANLSDLRAAPHGDSDCALQQLLHERKPSVCPPAPYDFIEWMTKIRNSTAFQTLYPPICVPPEQLFPVSAAELTGISVGVACCLIAVVLCGTRFTRATKRMIRKYRLKATNSKIGRVGISAANRWTSCHQVGTGRRSGPQSTSCLSSLQPSSSRKLPPKIADLTAYARSVLQPIAAEMCNLFGFQQSQTEFHGSSSSPGHFRLGDFEVPSNESNTVEHLAALFSCSMQRSDCATFPEKLVAAIESVHERSLSSFSTWCRQMRLRPSKLDSEGKLQQLVLFYLIWGEAANLRHMPEVLHFILFCMSDALLLENIRGLQSSIVQAAPTTFRPALPVDEAHGDDLETFPSTSCLPRLRQEAETAAVSSPSPSNERFLSLLVTPFYELIAKSAQAVTPSKHNVPLSRRIMYDDINEFFWNRGNVDFILSGKTEVPGMAYSSLLRALSDPQILSSRLRKTFYELPTWMSVVYTFYRVLLLNALAVHVMAAFTFTRQSCEIEAERAVPEVHLLDDLNKAIETCLVAAHGNHGFRILSSVALTHAGLQLVFNALSFWRVPLHARAITSIVWSLFSFSSPMFIIAVYTHERLYNDPGSGLTGLFERCSFCYCIAWLPALIQVPIKFPQRAPGGISPQWTMRPPFIAALLYCSFWVVVLGCKWTFEYFLIIKEMYLPTLALWQADYSCWELGHTGEVECIWDRSSSEVLRSARDWTARLVLIGLRWALPLLLIISDTMIFYMVVLAFASSMMGYYQGLGSLRTWSHLVVGFMHTQELFALKMVAYSPEEEEGLQSRRISGLEKAVEGFGWSYEGTCREWRDFAVAWNAFTESLRARDHLSNLERDDLIFRTLNEPEHVKFFHAPSYTVLPSMLSAPIFTGTRDKSLVSPSFTAYSAMRSILLQMRDLMTYLLVVVGVLEESNSHNFRGLLSNLMRHAQLIFKGKVDDRRLLRKLVVLTEKFVDNCSVIANASFEPARPVDSIRTIYDSLDRLLDEVASLLPRVDDAHQEEDAQEGSNPNRATQSGTFFALLKESSMRQKRTMLIQHSSHNRFDAEGDDLDYEGIELGPPMLGAEQPQQTQKIHNSQRRKMMATLLNVLRLHEDITPRLASTIIDELRKPASRAVLDVLSRQFYTHNPGGEPHSHEAKRQFFAFCSSLKNVHLTRPPPVFKMKSVTAFTPHFSEDVTYSLQTLLRSSDENATLLGILKALHPEDWTNLCERIDLQEGDFTESETVHSDSLDKTEGQSVELWNYYRLNQHADDHHSSSPPTLHDDSPVGENRRMATPRFRLTTGKAFCSPGKASGLPDLAAGPSDQAAIFSEDSRKVEAIDVVKELRTWASDRAQVLSRTVRGVMLNAEALRIQARLDHVSSSDVEDLVASRFEYVISSQIYQTLKNSQSWSDSWKAECIDELRYQFPRNLRVAYIESTQSQYFSVLLGVDQTTQQGKVMFKVKLPGNPIIGEGKPENQNHAIIFTRGELLQTLDMNQDNYLGEALKLRNFLECFKGSIRLVGCREYIFSHSGGAVATFAAASEFAFGTILQRFMCYPLSVRFHYGHPDVWDKLWALSNGGVAKASKMLHLSEDIFGGMNVIARGGLVSYCEFIHVGKGRDVTFIATNGFDQKISGGNAFQSISRDMSRFAHHADLARVLSFWCSAQGFIICTVLIIASARVLAITILVLAMFNLEGFFHTVDSMHDIKFFYEGKPNFGTRGGQEALNAQFLFQLGFLTLIPLIAEECLEYGFRKAFSNFVRQQVALKLFYTLFLERTRAFYFDRAIQLGQARYIATGRSLTSMTSNFTTLFKLYARSHLLYAFELGMILTTYGLYSRVYKTFPSTELGYYAIYTTPIWLLVASCAFSPWLFNPASFSSRSLHQHFSDFLTWLDLDSSQDSWQLWQDTNLAILRSSSYVRRCEQFVTRVLPLRVLFLFSSMAAFEVEDTPPTSLAYQREGLSISIGACAIITSSVLFFVADSGSTRRLFKGVWSRFMMLWALRVGMAFAFCSLCFLFANEILPKTRRNIISVLITGACWLTLTTGALELIDGRLDWKRSSPRRFADFIRRESDICAATVLFVSLQAISLLPITYLHSLLIVNQAYAASLRVIRQRQKLMLTMHVGGWWRSARRSYLSLRRSTVGPCLIRLEGILVSLFRREDRMGAVQQKVFVPAQQLPVRMNEYGPFKIARKWDPSGEMDALETHSRRGKQGSRRSVLCQLQRLSTESLMELPASPVPNTGRSPHPMCRDSADTDENNEKAERQGDLGSVACLSSIAEPDLPCHTKPYGTHLDGSGHASGGRRSVSSGSTEAESPSAGGAVPEAFGRRQLHFNFDHQGPGQPQTQQRSVLSRLKVLDEESLALASAAGTGISSAHGCAPSNQRMSVQVETEAAESITARSPSITSLRVQTPDDSSSDDDNDQRDDDKDMGSPMHRRNMQSFKLASAADRMRKRKSFQSFHLDDVEPLVVEDGIPNEMNEPCPPAPARLCRMPVVDLRSANPKFIRDLLYPIALNLSECFGFQSAHQTDAGQIVPSSMENQIDHLAGLLKWRMDFTDLSDPQRALESAVGELHHKIFANYKRWTSHVNVQLCTFEDHTDDNISPSSKLSFQGFSHLLDEHSVPLSALSGDAWDFIGMWGFTSGEEERKWVCNAQLHQLMLWFLIWGEAANLRHMPEVLCFITYCATNALQLSSRSAWELASLVDEVVEDGPYPMNDFLDSIVTPIWAFIEYEVSNRSVESVFTRVMYDDVNESFWSSDRVHALLPEGCAQQQSPHARAVPGMALKAYVHVRKLLRDADKLHAAHTLKSYFHKTYLEHTGVVHLFESFSRIFTLHAVLLHISVVVAFTGFQWPYLCTVVITHALLKALRTAALMFTLWPLKRSEQDSALKQSSFSRKVSTDHDRAFLAFVRNGALRMMFFLSVPLAFIAENVAASRWNRSECASVEDWCDTHVRFGVSDAQLTSCIGLDGIDYMLEYCKDCRPFSATRAHCGALSSFASDCAERCNSHVQEGNIYFQILAAIYTSVYIGSAIIFTRSGSLARFIWYPHSTHPSSFGLETPYIAAPSLLRLPFVTSLEYTCVWGIILAIKILVGYYCLVLPYVEPIKFVVQADFSCWTWTGSQCDKTINHDGAVGAFRSVVITTTILFARLSVPGLIYFSDTYLWFAWTIGVFSALKGWWMQLGKLSKWSHVIETFGESCALCNEMLIPPSVNPLPQPYAANNLKLLTVREMQPKRLAEAYAFLSIEARSIHWQRWGRIWNEVVFNLRERDLVSNAERDELLFVALREPEHVQFFGVSEYLVFPTMLASPVFYSRLWRYGLFLSYPNALRTFIQMRDLFAWLLTSLGIVDIGNRTSLLRSLCELARCVVVDRSPSNDELNRLTSVQDAFAVLLVSLLQSAGRKDAMSPMPTEEHELKAAQDIDSQFSRVLDAVKLLVSGSKGSVQLSIYEPGDKSSQDSVSALEAYRHFRSLVSLKAFRNLEEWQRMQTKLQSKAVIEVLEILHRSVTNTNPGGEPANTEARRQLIFFCNSLRNRSMPRAVPLRKMPSVSSFTSYKDEGVSYSSEDLHSMGDDDVNLEHLLQALFPNDWQNMCDRLQVRGDSSKPVPEKALMAWASDRGQLLSRTIRGVMLYGRALRIQARLEGVPEVEVEAIVKSKFECVLACQAYSSMRSATQSKDSWRAACIDELRHQHPRNFRIAYVDGTENGYFSILLGVNPSTDEDEILFKVKLPGNPYLSEGKPENQNQAIIFTRGEYLQTLDMNQDNYLCESLKLRNLLGCFKGNTRIVGYREFIFSQSGGAVAEFAATKEFVFCTGLQRFMAYPLSVRFHNGHPDIWDKQWALTNGGVSKPSTSLNVSKDVFAGMNCVMRGGNIAYHEFIHVGKGRDLSFDGVNLHETKESSASALQCYSRELHRLGKHFDLPRLMSLYCTSTGYYISSQLNIFAIQLVLMGWLLIALTRTEELNVRRTAFGELEFNPEWNTPGPAGAGGRQLAGSGGGKVDESFYYLSELGFIGQLNQRLDAVRKSWRSDSLSIDEQRLVSWDDSSFENTLLLFQLIFSLLVPYFLELWIEHNLMTAFWENLKRLLSFSWVFNIFTARTNGYHFMRALTTGRAEKVDNSSSYIVDSGSLLALYASYAQSHLYHAVEVLFYLIIYRAVSSHNNGDSWTVRAYAFSMLLAPLLLHSQMVSMTNIKPSYIELKNWFAGDGDAGSREHFGSWHEWTVSRNATHNRRWIRKFDLFKLTYVSLMLLCVAARLNTDEDSESYDRMIVVLSSCGIFFLVQLAYYVLALIGNPFLSIGPRFIGLAWPLICFRVLLAGGAVVGYFLLQREALSRYVILDASSKGQLNTFLLFCCGLLSSCIFIQAFALNDSENIVAGERQIPSICMHVKKQRLKFAYFWMFGFDVLLAFTFLILVVCLSMLPVLSLQSQLLFNRSFSKLLALKLRRSELLHKVLA